MNRRIFIGVIVVGLGAHVCSHQPETPVEIPAARTAVVDLKTVLEKYDRAQQFKKELEEILAPYKAKGKELTDLLHHLEKDVVPDPRLDPTIKRMYDELIRSTRAELEEMDAELPKRIAARQARESVVLWQEINMGVKAVAEAHGFQIVLGYNSPNPMHSIRHDRNAAFNDMRPLFIQPSNDITNVVIDTLNKWACRNAPTKEPKSAEPKAKGRC